METSEDLQRKAKPEERVVFAAGGYEQDSPVPRFLLLGVSRDAYRFMSGGRTHTFDLRYLGLPTQIIMMGGKSRAHILDALSMFMGDTPKVADMHSEHPVQEDEQAIPRIRKATRAYLKGLGLEREFTDAEIDGLMAAMLQQGIEAGDLRGLHKD